MEKPQIVLFHSALGLRPAVRAFAERLRSEGHHVHTPDLFDGETFDDVQDGVRKRDAVGIPTLIARAQAAVETLPADVIYAGFSMGCGPAGYLAATRPGARGAILMHGALVLAQAGLQRWPDGVPVQIHYAEKDEWVNIPAANELALAARQAGAKGEVFVYEGSGHLFADFELPEYDGDSSELMIRRVIEFCGSL